MFDKKYVLKCLYPIVCMDIHNEEKRIQYGLENYNNKIGENLENVVEVTREMIRDRERIIDRFNEWDKKKMEDN